MPYFMANGKKVYPVMEVLLGNMQAQCEQHRKIVQTYHSNGIWATPDKLSLFFYHCPQKYQNNKDYMVELVNEGWAVTPVGQSRKAKTMHRHLQDFAQGMMPQHEVLRLFCPTLPEGTNSSVQILNTDIELESHTIARPVLLVHLDTDDVSHVPHWLKAIDEETWFEINAYQQCQQMSERLSAS